MLLPVPRASAAEGEMSAKHAREGWGWLALFVPKLQSRASNRKFSFFSGAFKVSGVLRACDRCCVVYDTPSGYTGILCFDCRVIFVTAARGMPHVNGGT